MLTFRCEEAYLLSRISSTMPKMTQEPCFKELWAFERSKRKGSAMDSDIIHIKYHESNMIGKSKIIIVQLWKLPSVKI